MINGIRVGELDRRIIIKSPAKSNDEVTNEEIVTYSILFSVWAKRMGPKSSETFEARQQVAQITARYLVRYKANVTEEMILVDGSDTYAISGIEVMDRKSALILTVEKRDIPGYSADDAIITADTTQVTSDSY